MYRINNVLFLLSVAVPSVLFLSTCGGNNDSTPSAPTATLTVSAPALVSPVNGALQSGNVTFTVSNAAVTGGDGTPSYAFQVSTDANFTDILTQGTGISQGTGGQTSWTSETELSDGDLYWRVSASVGSVTSSFSSVGEFRYSSIATSGSNDTILLYDPLTTGSSLGDVGGGEFTSEGWKVIASSNFIVYDMPTIETGFVEFDVKGLDIRNPSHDARHLIYMWDPSLGNNMTTNRFRVSLQKLDGRSSINDRWLRLRFITQGRQIDVANTFRGWIPENTYRIRLEWGREGDVNVCRVFINDDQKMFFQYNKPYIPVVHRIELGAAPRAETPEGAIYSNITIGTR